MNLRTIDRELPAILDSLPGRMRCVARAAEFIYLWALRDGAKSRSTA